MNTEPKVTVDISPHGEKFWVCIRINGKMTNCKFLDNVDAINAWIPDAKIKALEQFEIAEALKKQHN